MCIVARGCRAKCSKHHSLSSFRIKALMFFFVHRIGLDPILIIIKNMRHDLMYYVL